jgi:hypothetical protein
VGASTTLHRVISFASAHVIRATGSPDGVGAAESEVHIHATKVSGPGLLAGCDALKPFLRQGARLKEGEKQRGHLTLADRRRM